ncbi:MAG: hypothetical protein IPN76_15855 [Saprospiraceae bacterium]|nr:hypothetical protein [Saprospiraceae bacterium]
MKKQDYLFSQPFFVLFGERKERIAEMDVQKEKHTLQHLENKCFGLKPTARMTMLLIVFYMKNFR